MTLTDTKGRRKSLVLKEGAVWHTTHGAVRHDDLLGGPEGVVIRSAAGMEWLAFRPILNEFMVSMPREAAVIYPKDAAQILMWTDIFPGARVLEAGVGSGALTLALLRAIGPDGKLMSYERRQEFADVAAKNIESFLGDGHPTWELRVGDLVEAITDAPIDRAILDMLAPWECIDAVGERMVPGGVLCCYVATTTQLGRVADTLRAHGGFTEPVMTETTVRDWHAEGLAIRPGHATASHTGFLLTSKRLAPGQQAPMRKRRPAPGAYGPDYVGPRPRNIPEQLGGAQASALSSATPPQQGPATAPSQQEEREHTTSDKDECDGGAGAAHQAHGDAAQPGDQPTHDTGAPASAHVTERGEDHPGDEASDEKRPRGDEHPERAFTVAHPTEHREDQYEQHIQAEGNQAHHAGHLRRQV
nr:tRNA (adenine-N1)-methyltransferase [uncultured Tessaracoccus sp.]